MITGPEASIVARAGGSVVKGVKQRAAATQGWPSLFEGLMELFAILDDWVAAARQSQVLIHEKLEGRQVARRRLLPFSSPLPIFPPNNYHMITEIKKDVSEHLTPKVSLTKHFTPQQRKAAARRTLGHAMKVYCPDLLADFNAAVQQRWEWVEANRDAITKALASDTVDEEALLAWQDDASTTLQDLVEMTEELRRYIVETFPVQWRAMWM
ncbi:hypothetical protein OHU25_41240 [Streptomyces sp. NBC_00117]|uniref:hypothetical protein n=1 Tax=Streptomyces sp. NBC_00117 TaxID=2975657 RepID=UPI003255B632